MACCSINLLRLKSRNEGAEWAALVVQALDGQQEIRGMSGIRPQIIHQVASFPPVEGGRFMEILRLQGVCSGGGHGKASRLNFWKLKMN
jgi:hypothetical protein